jgi:hypothetical protein
MDKNIKPKKGKLLTEYVQPVLVASVAREAVVGNPKKVENKYPKESVEALELLLQGHGADYVREKTGLGWDAIVGLKARHETALEVRRQQLAADGWEMAEGIRLLMKKKMKMLADDDEMLAKTSLKDLAVAKAVEQDKSFQALGENNKTVIEHRSGKPSLADAMAAITEARAALQKEAVAVEATVVTEATL